MFVIQSEREGAPGVYQEWVLKEMRDLNLDGLAPQYMQDEHDKQIVGTSSASQVGIEEVMYWSSLGQGRD